MIGDIEKRTKNGDDMYVRSRSVDRSWWIKTAYFLDKYKLIWFVLVGIVAALGFGFQTPAQHYDNLKKTQDSMVVHQTKIDSNLSDVRTILRILVAGQCMDRTSRELAYMGLDCSRYTQYRQTQH